MPKLKDIEDLFQDDDMLRLFETGQVLCRLSSYVSDIYENYDVVAVVPQLDPDTGEIFNVIDIEEDKNA